MRNYRPIRRSSARLGKLTLSDRIVLCLMFLLPVPTFLGEVAARSADMVRFGSVFTHLFTRARFGRGKHIRRITIILLLMFLFAFLSFVAGESHSIRDLLDVFRIAAFWAVFIFGASLCWRGQSQFDAAVSFSKFLLLIGTLNAMFTLAQYTFPIATRPVQAFYANDERQYRPSPRARASLRLLRKSKYERRYAAVVVATWLGGFSADGAISLPSTGVLRFHSCAFDGVSDRNDSRGSYGCRHMRCIQNEAISLRLSLSRRGSHMSFWHTWSPPAH